MKCHKCKKKICLSECTCGQYFCISHLSPGCHNCPRIFHRPGDEIKKDMKIEATGEFRKIEKI